ncbi:MAG TPA: amidohydrolase family protein, partial [Steroidobacteraceae bacterium]
RYAFMKPLQKTIREYLRSNVLITTSGMAWAPAILFTQQIVGEDRVMYAMDYPYQFHADEVRTHDNLDIPLARKKKLMQANAERWFRL